MNLYIFFSSAKVLWENSEAAMMLQADDSFLIVINSQQKIVFTSPNVEEYMGHKQVGAKKDFVIPGVNHTTLHHKWVATIYSKSQSVFEI